MNVLEHMRKRAGLYSPSDATSTEWISDAVFSTWSRTGVDKITVHIEDAYTIFIADRAWMDAQAPGDLLQHMLPFTRGGPNFVRGEILASAFAEWSAIVVDGKIHSGREHSVPSPAMEQARVLLLDQPSHACLLFSNRLRL